MIKSMIVAGGCFWCVEHDLRIAPGVISVTSGYSGDESVNPTYENHAGHREVILVEYDDTKTSYKKLLQFFIDHIDSTDRGGQFADRGQSYAPAIFFENRREEETARKVIDELDKSQVYEEAAAVDILARKPFYKAEEYHQNYAEKNPGHYNSYRRGSGREGFVQNTCQIRAQKKTNWSK